MSHCASFPAQGLPGTLHDLNGDLLVRSYHALLEGSLTVNSDVCPSHSVLCLFPTVSGHLPPWSSWSSWDARIQGKKSFCHVFLLVVSGYTHNSVNFVCTAVCCLSCRVTRGIKETKESWGKMERRCV